MNELWLQLWQAQVQIVKGLAESRPLDQNSAAFASKVSSMLSELVKLQKAGSEMYEAALEKLWSEECSDDESAGAFLSQLFDGLVEEFELLRDFVPTIQAAGFALPASKEFEAAYLGACRIQAELAESWPKIDYDMIRESTASYHRGEGKELGAIINELQGSDRPAG